MKPHKLLNPSESQELQEAELAQLMSCARWLTAQFENIGLPELGRLYQKTLMDAEVWLQALLPNKIQWPYVSRSYSKKSLLDEIRHAHLGHASNFLAFDPARLGLLRLLQNLL